MVRLFHSLWFRIECTMLMFPLRKPMYPANVQKTFRRLITHDAPIHCQFYKIAKSNHVVVCQRTAAMS
jgi:hypothetical protein